MAIQIRPNPFMKPAKAESTATAKVGRPKSAKIVVSIRLDPDVVERFRATGHGWQARINDALKTVKIP